MSHDVLTRARLNINDEFYTRYEDIDNELSHYIDFFKNKIIYCPCDSPESNFVKYFKNNYDHLSLKGFISSDLMGHVYSTKDNDLWIYQRHLEKNWGDIFSENIKSIILSADIIITNPPFSKLKNFIDLLERYEKKYILVANENVLVHPLVFPYIKNNTLHTGFTKIKYFETEKGLKSFGNTLWITNLAIDNLNPPLKLNKKLSDIDAQFMENYEALNINKIADIPVDYFDIMGVPITYIKKHCPKQFEILGYAGGITKNSKQNYDVPYKEHPDDRGGNGIVNGKRLYGRVFIKRKV